MRKVITPASNLGITLADAKEFLRVEHDYDDSIITSMIKASTLIAQNFIGQQLTQGTFAEAFGSFEKQFALLSPLQEISSVKYYDEYNQLQTIDSSNYAILNFGFPNYIVFANDYEFPTVYDRSDAIQITYIAGTTEINDDICAWIKIRIATLFEYRTEYDGSYTQLSKLDSQYMNQMLYPYKVWK